jgi:hypothetical protein
MHGPLLEPRKRAVVDKAQATLEPYPYVYVNTNGSARELGGSERSYLETPFSPFDGGRPYVKESYSTKNGGGKVDGFLARVELPNTVEVHPTPAQDPCPPRPYV